MFCHTFLFARIVIDYTPQNLSSILKRKKRLDIDAKILKLVLILSLAVDMKERLILQMILES